MAWKPKEKELTLEEAVALARKELAPLWHGSPPLIAAIQGRGMNAFPLDPEFTKKSWFIVFFDPTNFEGEAAARIAHEYARRYEPEGLHFMAVLKPSYHFASERKWVEGTLKRLQISFPAVVDADGNLEAAFGDGPLPRVVLWNAGKTVLRDSGQDWILRVEPDLQAYLRSKDPGLPLLPALETYEGCFRAAPSLNLGRGKGSRAARLGFSQPGRSGFSTTEFPAREPEIFDSLEKGAIALGGKWMQDEERIATSDPEATLSFVCPASQFSLLAQSLAKTVERCKIAIEINRQAALDTFRAGDLEFDEDGSSVMMVDAPRLYHALAKLEEKERQVVLRFPTAQRNAVALYALHFASSFAPAESTG